MDTESDGPMGPSTVRIGWVNNGEPFEVSADLVTPGIAREAKLRRIHVLKEHLAGLGALDPEDRALVRAEVMAEAQAEEAMVLLHRFLAAVDPGVGDMGPEDVLNRLTVPEVQAILRGLKPDTVDDAAPEVPGGAEDPLE